jgi:hypothetical protein
VQEDDAATAIIGEYVMYAHKTEEACILDFEADVEAWRRKLQNAGASESSSRRSMIMSASTGKYDIRLVREFGSVASSPKFRPSYYTYLQVRDKGTSRVHAKFLDNDVVTERRNIRIKRLDPKALFEFLDTAELFTNWKPMIVEESSVWRLGSYQAKIIQINNDLARDIDLTNIPFKRVSRAKPSSYVKLIKVV